MNSKREFIRVIKENEGIIFKITKVYANDKEDQKDLYQEIVYQLWKSFDSFKGNSKISTWIYRVALNTTITHTKRQKRKGYEVAADDFLADKINEHDTIMKERMHIVYTHIKTLNLVDRGLILLFLDGKSYEEMATITGFTATNVGTRLTRIKQKLKSQIKK